MKPIVADRIAFNFGGCFLIAMTWLSVVQLQTAHAQSAQEYKEWLAWCESIGTPNYDPNRPVCTPRAKPTSPPPPVQTGPTQQQLLEERRREAERLAEAKRRAAAAEQQRKFIEERDAAKLKGGTGSDFFGTGGLKGVPPAGSGIKDLKPATSQRDLGGATAVWKQLNCAASIGGYMLGTLLHKHSPDYDEFNYLAGQATSALNGDRLGVQCPAAPVMPKFNSPADVLKRKMEAVIRRARADADILKGAQARRKVALDDLIEAKKKLAELQGGSNQAAEQELAKLQAQRQAMGPLTVKPAAPPPSPGAVPPKITEPGKTCPPCEEAAAAATVASGKLSREEKLEADTKRDLTQMAEALKAMEKGKENAESLLSPY